VPGAMAKLLFSMAQSTPRLPLRRKRLLSAAATRRRGDEWECLPVELGAKLNQYCGLIYHVQSFIGLE